MKGLLFTFLLTGLGVVAGVINPFVGLCCYYALSLLKPESLWFWAVTPRRYVFAVAISTLIGWVIAGFGRLDRLGRIRTPLFFLAVFGIAYWLSWLNSDFSGSWDVALEITKVVLMPIVAVTLIDSFRRLRIFTWVVLLSVGYLALEMNINYYQGWQRLWLYGFAGIDNNGMAMVFGMTIPLAVVLGGFEKKWYFKALALGTIPFLANAIMFAFSRSGMLGASFTVPFMYKLLPNRKYATLMIIGVVLVGGVLAGPTVVERFETIFAEPEERDASAASRFDTWGAAWQCMKDHPAFGVGPRCFNRVAHRYGLGKGKSVHSVVLQIGADTGFLGAGMFVGFLGSTAWLLWRQRKHFREQAPWVGYWSAITIPAIGAYMLSSLFIGMEKVELPYIISAIGLAAIRVAELERNTLPAKPPTRPSKNRGALAHGAKA